MKHLFFLLAIFLCTSSCQSDLSKKDLTKSKSSIEQLANSNEFIDVNMESVISNLNSHSQGSRMTDDERTELNKIKAAVYRLSKHVKVVDNQFVIDDISAEDINISKQMFDFYKSNIEDMNASARERIANGEEVVMPPIDDNYRNSLLKE